MSVVLNDSNNGVKAVPRWTLGALKMKQSSFQRPRQQESWSFFLMAWLQFSLGLNGSSKPVWIFPETPVWALQAKRGNILAYRFPNLGKWPLTKTCPSPSVALVLLTPSVTENDGVRWITIVNLSTCCYNAGNIRSCQISHPLTLHCIYLHRDVMPKLMNKLLKTQSRMEGLSGRNTVEFRHDIW